MQSNVKNPDSYFSRIFGILNAVFVKNSRKLLLK